MKKLLAILVLFTACRKHTEPTPKYNLGVAMHSNFEADKVKIYIDNQVLFDGEVFTEHTLSLAKSISTTAAIGAHSIKVIVNSSAAATDQFDQSSNLYVGISFDKVSGKVSFRYSLTPFVYD